MKVSFWALATAAMLLSGCGQQIISPKCNLLDITRSDELNQIAVDIQVNDRRNDPDRYWYNSENTLTKYQIWEPDSSYFGSQFWAFSKTKLYPTSAELIKKSLSDAFLRRGYMVHEKASAKIKATISKFLSYKNFKDIPYYDFSEIDVVLFIEYENNMLFSKPYTVGFRTPPPNWWALENVETNLSNCLATITKEIVLDNEIEIVLKKAYGISVQEEQVTVSEKEDKPKVQDSPMQEKRNIIISTGTGFAICENGYIATAHHVIKDAESIYVKFQDDEWIDAIVMQKSQTNDIAILKVNRNTNHFLAFSDNLRQGDKVFTLGYPVPGLLGEEPKYAEGSVSSLTGIVDDASLMQISVPLQPGNSGGPLLNEKAEVVGMATSGAGIEYFYEATGTLPQNVNWGIKATFIKPLMPLDCIFNQQSNATPVVDTIEMARKAVCFIKVERKHSSE